MPQNPVIADLLEQIAALLDAQGADPFRVRAYLAASRTAREWPGDLREIYRTGGVGALDALPNVGPRIATLIAEILETGHSRMLDTLLGAAGPELVFTVVPGIGPELARRIHDQLGISSLEELELAVHDGRLQGVLGFGPRRARAVRDALAARHRPGAARVAVSAERPPVQLLVAVDEDYRRRAAAGELPVITPRRFNPSGEAWLPILHEDRDGWSFTALYSNTALAHRLGRTRDWVIVHYDRDGAEGQCTVVTETRGRLAGSRVVRGLEQECAEHHRELRSA